MTESVDYSLYRVHELHPNRIAVVYGDRSCTFLQLHDSIKAYASYLRSVGVERGDKVALWGYGSINWLVAFFGIVRAGGVAVLVNHSLRIEDVTPLLQIANARFLVCGDTVASREVPNAMELVAHAAGIPEDHCIVANTSRLDLVEQYEHGDTSNVDGLDRTALDETAFIIFTSGTTSLPKAVQLSRAALMYDARGFSDVLGDAMGLTVLCGAPLFHILGLLVANAYLAHGGTVILPANNKPQTIANTIAAHDVTDMVAVGAIYVGLEGVPTFEQDVSPRLRLCMIAGGMSTPVQMMRMECNFANATFINMYGLSESAPLTMVSPSDLVDLRAYTVGRALDGVTLRITDGEGNELPAGEVGEVWAQSPGLTNGYLGLPAEDQPFDSQGWLHTGDLGLVDENGYLYLSGRAKELIIRGGENIVPSEVESEILKLPNIADAKVMGAPHPSLGESVEACVTLKDASVPFSENEVRAQLLERLPRFKVPSHVFCYDEFPLLANGKLNVRELRANMLNKVLRAQFGEELAGGIRVFDLVIRSMRYTITAVSSMLAELASHAGFSHNYISRVKRAVEEIMAERTVDAYETAGDIRVMLTLAPDFIRISFSDDGAEYYIDKRKESSFNAKIVLGSVDNFRTYHKDGKPIYCMDFLYERDMDILDFLVKGRLEEQ
ncbi:MAG: class I adenylate-forming enzyme family protein [Coriobacteriales bacterium]|nr:class I adenylate-forming enzyme family protein [Coriobacteriales bacterium]